MWVHRAISKKLPGSPPQILVLVTSRGQFGTTLDTASSPWGGPSPTASSVACQTLEEKVLQILREQDSEGPCVSGEHVCAPGCGLLRMLLNLSDLNDSEAELAVGGTGIAAGTEAVVVNCLQSMWVADGLSHNCSLSLLLIGIQEHPLIFVKCGAGVCGYSTTPSQLLLRDRDPTGDSLGLSHLPLHPTPGS